MARPALTPLDSGQQSWDATINDNNDVMTDGPLPVVRYAAPANLPTPGSYEECLATTEAPSELWHSDGSEWRTHGPGSPDNSGARGGVETVSEHLTGLSGASVATSGLIPAGVFLLGVSIRVTTIVAGPTDFDVGDGTDADRFAATVALAAGTTKTPADATADPTGWAAGAREVTLTANGGNFTSGAVRVVASFVRLTAPTA